MQKITILALAMFGSLQLLAACGDCSDSDLSNNRALQFSNVIQAQGANTAAQRIDDCLNKRPPSQASSSPPCGCGCT